MSNYQFIASTKELPEYDNGIIRVHKNHLISHRQDSYGITEKDVHNAMRIIHEDDLREAKKYTQKKYCVYIEWMYSDKNAHILLNYLKENLSKGQELELWNTWLGDSSPVKKEKHDIDKLSKRDISNLWNKGYFEEAECMVVYKK